jgi:muramoyltetrapeptide carboxypeptidase
MMSPLTIAIPALMGHLRDSAQYARACERLRAMGHTLIEDPHVYKKHGFVCAPAAERLRVFHDMLRQRPDVVMPVRGGYGITHLLPDIDWALVRASGAKCVGFSDFTGFSMAALTHGIVTYAGPMAASDFGNERVDEFADAHCWNTLASGACEISVENAFFVPTPQMRTPIEGMLWGTNLSLLAHLVGTPYLPHIEGGILLVEDIGEEPYACDRALMQLDHAGILRKQRAVIIGAVNGYDLEGASAKSYPFEVWVDDLRRRYEMPVLTDFPFGHVARKATLPIGGHACVTISEQGYTLGVTT